MTAEISYEEGRYAPIYLTQQGSPTFRRLYEEVYAADYPSEIEPFGFVTWSDLQRFAELLALTPGQTFADVGCGRGGPGLWLARESGAALVGVDIVAEAIEQADALRAKLGVETPCEFRVASFTDTGIEDAAMDAVLSVDALWMVLDKPAAVRETARILTPGGRFVFSSWQAPYLDYAKLLTDGGLEVVSSEPSHDWLDRQVRLYQAVVAHADELRAELGRDAADVFIAEAQVTPDMLASTPRMIWQARRPDANRSGS